MVFDVYGASHPTCRGLLKKVIRRLEAKHPVEEKAATGRLVWASITTAVISRTIKQPSRVAQPCSGYAAGSPGLEEEIPGAININKRDREHGHLSLSTA